MQHLHKLHWLGCLHKSHGLFLFPAQQKLHRLQENVGAANIEFTKEELQQLTDASSHIKIEGERYPEALEKLQVYKIYN